MICIIIFGLSGMLWEVARLACCRSSANNSKNAHSLKLRYGEHFASYFVWQFAINYFHSKVNDCVKFLPLQTEKRHAHQAIVVVCWMFWSIRIKIYSLPKWMWSGIKCIEAKLIYLKFECLINHSLLREPRTREDNEITRLSWLEILVVSRRPF